MPRKPDARPAASKGQEPRQLTRFQKSLLEEANRKITLRSDGGEQEASLSEIVIRKLFQVAASGSPHALGHVLRSINDAQTLDQELIRVSVEEGKKIKEWLQTRLDKAVHDGADPVWVVLHPDDIVIDEDKGWSMKGPIDEDGLIPIRQCVAMRDVLLLQSVLDERLAPSCPEHGSDVPAEEMPGSMSLALAHFLNDSLLERFRKSIPQMMDELARHQRLTKRELLKSTRLAWAGIGQPLPRGAVLPTWSEVGTQLQHLMRILKDVLDRMRAGETVSDQDIAERLSELLRR